MNNQTKKMTEGAMMVAIVGMLLFINRQLAGMLEMVMYWVLTFPILMYTARYGVKSACVPAISMVLLSFMIAAPTTIFYLFCSRHRLWCRDKKEMEEWNTVTMDRDIHVCFLSDYYRIICGNVWL